MSENSNNQPLNDPTSPPSYSAVPIHKTENSHNEVVTLVEAPLPIARVKRIVTSWEDLQGIDSMQYKISEMGQTLQGLNDTLDNMKPSNPKNQMDPETLKKLERKENIKVIIYTTLFSIIFIGIFFGIPFLAISKPDLEKE